MFFFPEKTTIFTLPLQDVARFQKASLDLIIFIVFATSKSNLLTLFAEKI